MNKLIHLIKIKPSFDITDIVNKIEKCYNNIKYQLHSLCISINW